MLPITAHEGPRLSTAIEVQGAIATAPGINSDGLHTSLSTGNLECTQEAKTLTTPLVHSGHDVVTALYSNWHRNLTGRYPELRWLWSLRSVRSRSVVIVIAPTGPAISDRCNFLFGAETLSFFQGCALILWCIFRRVTPLWINISEHITVNTDWF